jgi:hypothetical protein
MEKTETFIYKSMSKMANEDYELLLDKINGKSYKDAFELLEGFNESNEPNNEFFDFDFKSLNGTIYNKNGKCAISNELEVWLNEFYSPIGKLTIDENKKTEFIFY